MVKNSYSILELIFGITFFIIALYLLWKHDYNYGFALAFGAKHLTAAKYEATMEDDNE